MKRIALLTLSLLILAPARGDYIFLWDVDVGNGDTLTFSYASMYYGSGSDRSTYGAANIANDDGGDSGASLVQVNGGASSKGGTKTDSVWSNVGTESPDSKSFYFEIYDSSFTVLGSTKLFSFADYAAREMGDGLGSSSTLSGAAPFTVTESMFSVPEPTSALLMLFGLAGLALKRKRVDFKSKMKGVEA